VINPSDDAWNFTPNSTDELSLSDDTVGTPDGQIEHGQPLPTCAVVNDHVCGDAIATPDASPVADTLAV
jgi:hypothetical protein